MGLTKVFFFLGGGLQKTSKNTIVYIHFVMFYESYKHLGGGVG